MGQTNYIKERKKGEHLTYEDRQLIEYIVRKRYPKKVSIKSLRSKIGCSESTIRRELKRGKVIQISSELVQYTSYSAEVAQEHYDYQASNKGPNMKISNDYDFVKHVEYKVIKENYSPDAIIMELKNTEFNNPRTGREFKTKISMKTYPENP